MSKAFTNEEPPDAPEPIRSRSPLPSGTPNYVTERGLALLRAELMELDLERDAADEKHLPALQGRIAALAARIGSAVIPPDQHGDEIRFGTTVTVQDETGGAHTYRIVGVDEANAKEGRLAFIAPLASALMGRRTGDLVEVSTPRGEQTLTVMRVSHDSA